MMNMKNVVITINDGVAGMTSILSGFIVLGVFSSIIFGEGFMGVNVVANLSAVIQQFINGGFVGLVALLFLVGLWEK
jgi:hypothetical protein